MREIWRSVPGFGPYQVSNLGRVRRGRILAGFFDSDGYRRINTSLGGKAKQVPVHTLVLLAFKGPRPTARHTGAHWDGDISNNRTGNLRWATMPEQYADRRRHGSDVTGIKHPRAVIDPRTAAVIRRLYIPKSKTRGMFALCRQFKLTRGIVGGVLFGGNWE